MVLSGPKKVSQMSSHVNASQGGGSKKAGLYSSVGKDSWTNVAYGGKIGNCTNTKNCCMTLACMQTTRDPLTCASRPVGSLVVSPRFAC